MRKSPYITSQQSNDVRARPPGADNFIIGYPLPKIKTLGGNKMTAAQAFANILIALGYE